MDPEREIENSNINLEFGGTFVLIGQLDSAAAVFSKLLTGSRDQRARGLRSLAFLSMYRGHYAEAVRDLVEATRLNRLSQTSTSEVRNRLLLATSLAQRGLLAESTEQLDSAFALSARFDVDPILMFWLGKALARTGDIRRAEQVLALLDARRHPSNASAFAASEALKGEILTGQGTPHVALAHLESALSKDSSSAALESLAYAVARAGELERARLLYEEFPAASCSGTRHRRRGASGRYGSASWPNSRAIARSPSASTTGSSKRGATPSQVCPSSSRSGAA